MVFFKTFRKITKNLGFHITFKTADLQDIIYTSLAIDIEVATKKLYLYIPIFVPSAEMPAMLNKPNKKSLFYRSSTRIEIVSC